MFYPFMIVTVNGILYCIYICNFRAENAKMYFSKTHAFSAEYCVFYKFNYDISAKQ